MLVYDENGLPLKLHWNFLGSSTEAGFENIVRTPENLLSSQTQEYRGGWSLYDGESMETMRRSRKPPFRFIRQLYLGIAASTSLKV